MKAALFTMFFATVTLAQTTQRSVSGKLLTIDLDAAPMANLTYQLDCMAKLMPCSTDAYRALWKDLGWTDEDERALKRWSDVHQRYQGSIRLRDERRSELGYPLDPRGPNLPVRLRHAGLIATDAASFRAYFGLLAMPEDVDAAEQVLQRFWPRFEKWWAAKALKQLTPFVNATADLLTKKAVLVLIEQAAAFYEAELPRGFHLPMHLMFRPAKTGASHGQQLEQHSIIEVVDGEAPEDRVDVVAHELFHFFFASRSALKSEALTKQFLDAPSPDSAMAFGLLNEALATALGNGLVAKQVLPAAKYEAQLKKPRALYNDTAIDADAKHLLDTLEQQMKEGKTISSPEFVNAQIEAASAGGRSPSVYLRRMQLFQEPEFSTLTGVVRSAVPTNNVWSNSPLTHPQTIANVNESPFLSGVVLVSPAHLAHLASWPVFEQGTRDALATEAKHGAPFVYAARRGPKAWLWVLVAPDTATMTQLIERLPCAPAPVEGVVSTATCAAR